tara:strand:+ start:9360 stop:10913 length:1554 start_codon:yes stop_codon:yes gene_type:complete
MKLIVKFLVSILLTIVFLFLIYSLFNLRDRHRGYNLNINQKSNGEVVLRAGFSAISITPEILDRWNDTLGNYQYNPNEGDTYEDITESGRFDAVWMAGFQSRKPAQGVNDDLWARALVLDDGVTRLAWVVLDAIGFNGDDIISVRKQIPAKLGIDYAIISSTHTHSAPDLIGLWGPSTFTSGVNPEYVEKVKKGVLDAIELATNRLKLAYFRFSYDKEGAIDMLGDTREPIVINPIINVMQALDVETDSTLGTLVTWDNHPETIWNKNLLITSDFPHYLRETIENGIFQDGEQLIDGLGGTSIFAIGNIGGLMTTHPSVPIKSFISEEIFVEPSFEKVKAQGENLGILVLNSLKNESVSEMRVGSIDLRAKTIELPLDNHYFRLGAALGLFERGMSSWMNLRSEIAYWKLGPASFLHHPSELYPEIAYGGVESPVGQDFTIPPQEVPPLIEFMHGDYRFMPGLSNDMIGYVVPKSQWDTKHPFTYGAEKRPYGEINSLGPETGPILHRNLINLMLQK